MQISFPNIAPESIKGALTAFVVFPLLCLLYILVQEGRRTRQLMQYETAQGKIITSLLISDQYDEDGIVYESDIVYEFEVDGEKYTSSNIGATSYSESKEAFHQGLVDQYPKDEEVTVHYQRDNPENCILQTRLYERYARVAFYFAAILLLLTILASIPSFMSPQQASPQKQDSTKQAEQISTNSITIEQTQQPSEIERPSPFIFDFNKQKTRKERPYAANCARFPITCLRRPIINTPIIMGRRDPRIKLQKRYK